MRSMGKDVCVRLHVDVRVLSRISRSRPRPETLRTVFIHHSGREGQKLSSNGLLVTEVAQAPSAATSHSKQPPAENRVCLRFCVSGTHFGSPRWPVLLHTVFMTFLPSNLDLDKHLLCPWDPGSPLSGAGIEGDAFICCSMCKDFIGDTD